MNVGAKLKAGIKLNKVNLNIVQRDVFLFGGVTKQLKRFTFSFPRHLGRKSLVKDKERETFR